MDDERLLDSLQELQQAAGRLHQLTASLQAPTMRPVEKEDRSGAILVRLGEDGLPDRIRVTDDWYRRVHPGDIGQAVVEAYGIAMGARMKAWTAELERGSRNEDVVAPADGGAWGKPPSEPSEVPSMSELSEEAIGLLGDVGDAEPQEQRPPDVSPARRVVISLPGGRLSSCDVDARWARRQTARSLATALNSALGGARSELDQEWAAQEAGQEAQRQRAQALFNNALAVIKDPEKFAR